MLSKRHFIILEVETTEEQEPKAAEDKVLEYLRDVKRASGDHPDLTIKSVGWIADNVREAPTGKQEV